METMLQYWQDCHGRICVGYTPGELDWESIADQVASYPPATVETVLSESLGDYCHESHAIDCDLLTGLIGLAISEESAS